MDKKKVLCIAGILVGIMVAVVVVFRLSRDRGEWYRKYHVIAHSGGGIDGVTYANCLEGWNAAYQRGVRVYDADLNETSDGVPVLRHSWTDNMETTDIPILESETKLDVYGIHYKIEKYVPDYEQFISTKVYQKYTPMDLDAVIRFMGKHKDVYVSLDAKTSEVLGKAVTYFKDKGHEKLLDRVIVNASSFEGYQGVMSIYPFRNVVFRQHSGGMVMDWQAVADFCEENGIHVINISSDLYCDTGIKCLKDEGLFIYFAVIDHISDMCVMQEHGCDGIISNWLGEKDWMKKD